MASKLPTPEIASEGVGTVTNLDTESSDPVIAIIKSALQSYLGSDYTITVIDVSNDRSSCRGGYMDAPVTGDRVMPNQAGTSLMYNTASRNPFVVQLLMCTLNNSTDTKFVYAWDSNGRGRWFKGSPYLTLPVTMGEQVPFTSRDISSELSGPNPVEAIENILGNMTGSSPPIGFNDPIYTWMRSKQDDNNFRVSKPMTQGPWYWAAEGTGTDPPVTLTNIQGLGGRFIFEQTGKINPEDVDRRVLLFCCCLRICL